MLHLTSLALLSLSPAPPPPIQSELLDRLRFTARGTVSGTAGPVPAVFASASIGDPVEFQMDVRAVPFPADPFGRIFSHVALPDGRLEVGSSVETGPLDLIDLSAVVVYDDYPTAGDVLESGLNLSSTDQAGLVLTLIDLDFTVFGSADLRDLVGVYPRSEFEVAQFAIRNAFGEAVLDFAFTEFEVERVIDSLGSPYCGPAVPNSTGQSASISARGAAEAAENLFELAADGLPPGQFGFFVASRSAGFVAGPGGSAGNLCLGGQIARVFPSLQNSGAAGQLRHVLDLSSVPLPSGAAPVLAGETWRFQAWFRDADPLPTSNLTDGLEVTFQ